jgi:hypothetical protein
MEYNSFTYFLIGLSILLGIAILAYLISRLFVQNKMLVSKPATSADPEADQYYYLPGYGLNLIVSARVQVTKNQDNKIVAKQLLKLDVEPEIVVQADTRKLITLKYLADPFSSDEVKIVTSPASLLQNISSDSTDRIATIVNLFTETPKQALGELKSIKETVQLDNVRPPETLTREIIEVVKTFKLTPEDIGSGEKIIELPVPVQDQTVNVSFALKNKNFKAVSLPAEFAGILTRPMSNQVWEVMTTDSTSELLASFTCYAPDFSRIIKVPVRRALFARRQQLPGFSNGLLIENHITKHSEIEGLASIPLNILKALVSIPAQLFQFRIIRNRLETDFEKSAVELMKAQEASRQESAKQWAIIREEMKQLTEKVGGLTVPPQEKVPALGKLPAAQTPARSFFEAMPKVLKEVADLGAVAAEAPFTIPSSVLWNRRFNGTLNNYKNTINGIQSCVPAAAAHMITFWTSNSRNAPTILTVKDVIDAYSRESGFDPFTNDNDTGCSMLNFLSNWNVQGIGGKNISSFARIVTGKADEVKHGIFLFGSCMVGLQMPRTARTQSGTWKFVDGQGSEPGSWGNRGGGHAVAAIGYDDEGLLVVSWGTLIKMEWKFYETYNDESYVALSPNWLTTGGTSPDPSNTTRAALEATIIKLSKP